MATISWITPWGQMAYVRSLNDGVARAAYDTPGSYVIGGAVPGYRCTPVRMFSSFDAYDAAEMTAGAWVCHDMEKGDGFPAPALEKQHPALAHSVFINKAKRRGHGLISAPGRDLVYVPGADNMAKPGEDINDAYLRCGIPGMCAGAQVLSVQSQGAQKDLVAFTNLLTAAKAQLPDPNQALWMGLTTQFATAKNLVDAYNAAMPIGVSGCWLTVTKDNAQAAVDFLKWACVA